MLLLSRRAALAVALFLLATLAPGAAAQPDASVTWTPHDATVEDVVVVEISGIWRDGCVPRLSAVHRDPSPEEFPQLFPDPDVPLFIASHWAIVLETFQGGCTAALTPYSVEVALSQLPAGHNRVLVLVKDAALVPPEEHVLDLVDIPVGGATDTLRLHGGRFVVTVEWHDFQGNTGHGTVVPGHARSSGLFSFFTPDNWEVMVKVLDGCPVNRRYWVFVAAATSVEYTLRIEDLLSQEVWEYTNPSGQLSPAFADTAAFGACESPAAR